MSKSLGHSASESGARLLQTKVEEENGPFEVRDRKMGVQVTMRSRQGMKKIRRNIGKSSAAKEVICA